MALPAAFVFTVVGYLHWLFARPVRCTVETASPPPLRLRRRQTYEALVLGVPSEGRSRMTSPQYPTVGNLDSRRGQMFPALGPAQIARVAALGREVSFEPGALVWEQGDYE